MSSSVSPSTEPSRIERHVLTALAVSHQTISSNVSTSTASGGNESLLTTMAATMKAAESAAITPH